jgi:hypothetical protein
LTVAAKQNVDKGGDPDLRTKNLIAPHQSGNIVRFFPVRAKDDESDISFFSKQLVRELPEILSPRIGEIYSASLVRQGICYGQAKVTIKIQSPNSQVEAIQQQIQEKIDQICEGYGRSPIPVHFSTGALANLCSTVEEAGQVDNEGSEEASEFPHHKLYWDTPGMGASIGVKDCREVTTTLGEFADFDGGTYALSVDHFITKSLRGNVNSAAIELTSPSMSDLQLMRSDLDQALRDMSRPSKRSRSVNDLGDAHGPSHRCKSVAQAGLAGAVWQAITTIPTKPFSHIIFSY